MEQDVDHNYRTVCTTCLSSDRDLFDMSSLPRIDEIFRLLMYDFSGNRLEISEIRPLICWECLAMFKKVSKFKWQVHSAQEHLRVLAMSHTQETFDHTYLSQSLSTLSVETKLDYDKIFIDFTPQEDCTQYITIDSVRSESVKHEQYELQSVDSNIRCINQQLLEVPQMVLDNGQSNVLSHIMVDSSSLNTSFMQRSDRMPHLTIQPLSLTSKSDPITVTKMKEEPVPGYITEYMSEEEMLATREEAKKKVQYASAVYKCELCIIGFYTQQQVEDHFEEAHRAKSGMVTCKICYIFVNEDKLNLHRDQHHFRYECKLCGHVEYIERLIQIHTNSHIFKPIQREAIKIEGQEPRVKTKRKKKKRPISDPPKPGDLRKLLSKTTIEGYKCLECDMFFKNSRARKNHVARFHREGLQCDHCKKRFVNKGTLTTHLKLHQGPLPREECPICHKMVRSIQIKYHVQRHENRERHECRDCKKIFSHLATYQAHLKYSRAHASDQIFKFPCPMCNKGYPTKEAMQDHFNYQHLGKTTHKCPICDKPLASELYKRRHIARVHSNKNAKFDKTRSRPESCTICERRFFPIASKSNVDKHIARVHGEKKEKPKNHVCLTCGKPFTDKKALTQHEAIHSGARPLVCDICQQTFKQKASLYTHKKRVHKVVPAKKEVHFMDKTGSLFE